MMLLQATPKLLTAPEKGTVKRLKQLTVPTVFFALMLLVSCGPIRETVAPDPTRHTLQETLAGIRQNETSFKSLNARFSGSATIEGSYYSINGTLRIKKDSAIFVSVAPLLGIEIARLLVTPDTVKMVNRIENTFYAGNMEILNRMLGTYLDYHMLEALLTGNDFNHFSARDFHVSTNNGDLILFSRNRHPQNLAEGVRFQNRLVVNSKTYRITENVLHENEAQRNLQVRYLGFSRVDNQLVPREISMIFSDRSGQTSVDLQFSRIVLNEESSFAFNIPGHYREIRF